MNECKSCYKQLFGSQITQYEGFCESCYMASLVVEKKVNERVPVICWKCNGKGKVDKIVETWYDKIFSQNKTYKERIEVKVGYEECPTCKGKHYIVVKVDDLENG